MSKKTRIVNKNSVRIQILTCVLTAISSGQTMAATFDYAIIADTTMKAPGGVENFTHFNSPSLSGSNVAFIGASGGRTGIYARRDEMQVVVDTNTEIPGRRESFAEFADVSVSESNVVFLGSGTYDLFSGAAHKGVYSDVNGIHTIASTNTAVPGGLGDFTDFASPSISDGNVAFVGQESSRKGIYTNVGGLSVVADELTTIPGSTHTFTDFGSLSHSAGNVAFQGSYVAKLGSGSLSGIYTDIGGLSVVADTNTAIPGASGNFIELASPSLSGGSVAFHGTGTDMQGIYTDIGGLSLVADTNTQIPGGSENFTNFDSPSLSDGDVAFRGGGAGQEGIYIDMDGLGVVADTNTTVPGSSAKFVNFESPSLSNGNVVFQGSSSDGQSGIYVAFQRHAWESDSGGNWDEAANWTFDTSPRDGVPTSIEPSFGAVVTGPAAPVHLRSLTINTPSVGTAELHTQQAGSLLIDETMAIGTRGKVRLNGVATASLGTTNMGTLELIDGAQLVGASTSQNAGIIMGDGQVSGALENSSNGEIRVGSGQRIRFTNGDFDNFGHIEAIGDASPAEIEFSSTLNNVKGEIFGSSAIMRFNGGLNNENTLALSFRTSHVFGDITNAASGTIALGGNDQVTFYDDVDNSGVLNVFTGSTAVFFGALSGYGNVGGGDVQMFGDLSPGFSPGVMDFGGDVDLGPSSSLTIELAGITEDEFDRLVVEGDATLAGNLDVSIIEGFSLGLGNSFEFLTVDGSLNGEFVGLMEGDLVGNFDGTDLFITYQGGDGNDVVLFTSDPVPGDFDRDGDVDSDDLDEWRSDYGGPGSDASGDGLTAGDDFLAWQRNFGYGVAANASAHSVPEPSGLLIVAGLVATLAAGRTSVFSSEETLR